MVFLKFEARLEEIGQRTTLGKDGMTASAPQRRAVRRISIIAPMLNESAHIASFIEDVANQDFEGEVELIVADGGSTDGAIELLRAAAAERELPMIVLPDSPGWVSRGLNACIARADGDLIVPLDCHSDRVETASLLSGVISIAVYSLLFR